MSFDEEGFLSPDLAVWTTATKAHFRPWFEMAEELSKDAMKILLTIQRPQATIRELTALLLYRRALQSFQGAVLLASRGMIADALTLVRVCAETAIALGAAASEEKFISELIEAADNQVLTYANSLLNDPDCLSFVSEEQINDLKKIAAEIKAKYWPKKPHAINWEQAAKQAKMADLYVTVYRLVSNDAAHTSLGALDRHIELGAHLTDGKLTFRPETRQLDHALSLATNALLHALEAMRRVFTVDGLEQTLTAYMGRWFILETSHPPMP